MLGFRIERMGYRKQVQMQCVHAEMLGMSLLQEEGGKKAESGCLEFAEMVVLTSFVLRR